jgi:hypothetical protein
MSVEGDVWLALNDLRAGHREQGCSRTGCLIASLSDCDLEEIHRAVPQHGAARLTEPAEIVVVRPAVPEPVGARRFKVGDRVVYDSECELNAELGEDYHRLGVCTVTGLEGEDSGQLLSFVDERGTLHDGWWADRFRAAAVAAPAEERENEVTYFVAFQSAAGYGYRVLLPRPRIVTAADVVALTDVLATDVGGSVVPLNWIELPNAGPGPASARPIGPAATGSTTDTRSTLAPIRIDRGHPLRNGSGPTAGTPQPQPAWAAGPGERPEVPYLPRRAM